MVMLASALLWALLWTSFSPFVLLSGALLGWMIVIVFPLPPMYWTGRLRLWPMIVLVTHLLHDLVTSSIRLVRFAFSRKVELHAGLVRVDLHTDDDLQQVGVATMIALVPGTVVVEVVRHPRRLYLHCLGLNENDSDAVREMAVGVERRLLRATGSDEDLQAFEEAVVTPTVAPATDWDAEAADDEDMESPDDVLTPEMVSGDFLGGETDRRSDVNMEGR